MMTRPSSASSWRLPHYRLMALSRTTGKAIRVASGTLTYLLRLATRGVSRGRKWIELSTAPASTLTLKTPRKRARRVRARARKKLHARQ
jgi:hypothetical protein